MSAIERAGKVLRCQVRGSLEPLLKVLATADVTELLAASPPWRNCSSRSTGDDDRAH